MGGTEKKILGASLLGLLVLGTGGVGPLAFLGSGAAAGGAGAAGAGATAAAAGKAGLGATLGGLVKPAAASTLGTVGGGLAMQAMQPDVSTPMPMPQMQQPDLAQLIAMMSRGTMS